MPAMAPWRLLPRARMMWQSANDGASDRLLVWSRTRAKQAIVGVEDLPVEKQG